MTNTWGDCMPLTQYIRLMADDKRLDADDKATLAVAASLIDFLYPRKPRVLVVAGDGVDPVIEAVAGMLEECDVLDRQLRTVKDMVEQVSDLIPHR